jgi:ABC-type antimicrobial peptide transport system permease subunit
MISVKDPSLTAEIFTMDDRFDEETGEARFYFWLLGGFALSGLLIAVVGVYGVMAYSVSQRTREIGIRMATGASVGRVIGLIVRQGMALVVLGVAIGLLASVGAAQLLRGMLYGQNPLDPMTFVLVTLLLVGVAAVATFAPARRAASVNPAITLRAD